MTSPRHQNKWDLELVGELPDCSSKNFKLSWDAFKTQFPKQGSPGISLLNDKERSFDVLIWCDEEGIPRGFLTHDKIFGTLNVVRDPMCSGKAIGRKLIHESALRWGIDLSLQTYTPEGLKMAKSALS